ncbi:hypothetical protein [Edaphobacter aggregans]|uniref:hypothetical protein n=1 Tax=Edaphobacter aggregans TaxID=570835 RepID=UPI00054D970C|nr:hypothetical protein [Edaphobacter aggregans]
MEKCDSNLDELYQDLADRFGALGRLFSQLNSPKATQELLNSLSAGDAAAFDRLIDRVELPLLGKCFWVREIIERVVVTPTGLVTECWLRDNLTPTERSLYYSIAFRHSRTTPIAKSMEVTLQLYTGRLIIPPGAFLDELKANGLVTCGTRMTYDTSTTLPPGRPERVCV